MNIEQIEFSGVDKFDDTEYVHVYQRPYMANYLRPLGGLTKPAKLSRWQAGNFLNNLDGKWFDTLEQAKQAVLDFYKIEEITNV